MQSSNKDILQISETSDDPEIERNNHLTQQNHSSSSNIDDVQFALLFLLAVLLLLLLNVLLMIKLKLVLLL